MGINHLLTPMETLHLLATVLVIYIISLSLINSNTSTFDNILYVYYCIPTDHCHATRSTAVDVQAKRKLIIASILCLLFMVGEAVGKFVVTQIFYNLNIIHVILIQKLLLL